MKALILGGGFAGCTTAYLLRRAGWEVTLIEREADLGGGCRTFFHCGHPFTYGPRLYYGYSAKVWDWVNRFVPLRRFPFELKTLAHEPVDEVRAFWTYPPHEADLAAYPRAAQIRAELAARDNSREPADFDEYYRQKVGPTLYEMFTDHYSRRMWQVATNKVLDLFRWSAKDRPIESGTREAYKGSLLGYPAALDGYNSYFEQMVEGCEVLLEQRAIWKGGNRVDSVFAPEPDMTRVHQADVIVSTLPVDELCGYRYGELPYMGRDFRKLLLYGCRQVLPGDVRWLHYAGAGDDFTRVTEFKKLTGYDSPDTLLVLETPSKNGRLYPVQTKANLALARRYIESLPPHVHSIGRLGRYLYSTIEQTITQAFKCAARITGQQNAMEGEYFAIGDTSLLSRDRKEEVPA